MAFNQWRKFNFFERELLQSPLSDHIKNLQITACTSGRGRLLFGDSDGDLHILNRDLQFKTIKIYMKSVTHLFQLKEHDILVTVGLEKSGVQHFIKVWKIDKVDGDITLKCLRVSIVPTKSDAIAVSCIAVHENLSHIAVGFVNGTVVTMKGDITKMRNVEHRIHEDRYPVTGLGYKQVGENTFLFVTTTETVMSFNISAKNYMTLLDHFGSNNHCSAVCDLSEENHFIIGRDDALYLYLPDVRTKCLPFEGTKEMVSWFQSYLVVVSKGGKQLPRTAGTGGVQSQLISLSVYDIENKFIAFSAPFPTIAGILGEWGSLHIITSEGKIFQLTEKDTNTKLQTLFRKNMYETAISLAKSQNYSDGLIPIFRTYGDHLYAKGDHDGAIQQYIQTIGHLEPSYVIRKFLDAQRIPNLTNYLQALHEKGAANTDHTTLLLNCYTKSKDINKLNDFITSDKDFDVETAIKVCRRAGYFDHALSLAEKYEQHESYIKVQLQDLKNYKKALNYMKLLPFEEAENNLKLYGKTLINHATEETTELLKQLCTDYKPASGKKEEVPNVTTGIVSVGDVIMSPIPARKIKRAYPDDFIHIFVHQKPKLKEFLEHMVKMRNDCSNVAHNTLLELYLHDASAAFSEKNIEKGSDEESKAYNLLTDIEARYDLDHAMVLTQMHNFRRGMLYLYEKSKSYRQILRCHMEHNEYDEIIEDCQKYGAQDPGLWSQALSYFAKNEKDCKKHIIVVLNHIDKYNLLSPLMVIETLAHNSNVTLGVVKDYIIRRLQHENEQIAKDERMIRKYREDTEKMRVQMEELKTSAKIFQNSKCMICSRPLELPAVHFLCGDSFHQSCFESYADGENECPVCAPENRKFMDILRAQEHNKDLHEQFNHQLERSTDGFSVVADYFGRGCFKKVSVFTDTKTQQPILPSEAETERRTLFN